MKRNIVSIDRAVRILAAIVIAGMCFANFISGLTAMVLVFFASVFLLISFLNFCPLYLPFRISTNKKQNSNDLPSKA